MNHNRIKHVKKGKNYSGPVIYWMSRDQRVHDNWALIYAQTIANHLKKPLIVIFNLLQSTKAMNLRHYNFMLRGLAELENTLKKLSIPFFLIHGNPKNSIPRFITKQRASYLISDFSPLRASKLWKETIGKRINCSFDEVDAHNICPVWYVSEKQEYAARTIRKKIEKGLIDFLEPFPEMSKQIYLFNGDIPENDWEKFKIL